MPRKPQDEEPHWCIHVEPKFKWYDIWAGIFIDTKNRDLYICPIPMFVLKIYIKEEGKLTGKMRGEGGICQRLLQKIGKV